jgi:hypothetical protein
MEFFTSDLQKEHAEFSLPGLATPSESLSTASHIRAFDLYRHNRVWDNNSYFSLRIPLDLVHWNVLLSETGSNYGISI